jgi:hypothetical protein
MAENFDEHNYRPTDWPSEAKRSLPVEYKTAKEHMVAAHASREKFSEQKDNAIDRAAQRVPNRNLTPPPRSEQQTDTRGISITIPRRRRRHFLPRLMGLKGLKGKPV